MISKGGDMLFENPILPGFYPDPSICKVNEDYYLVTSSFVYFPGLPIFHSKDLVHWEQIGHGISREEQIDYKNVETSLGLWAPTIRYHKGMFYIINTFVSGGREVYRDNFIITAKDPAGEWSDPVFIEGADGIDPSLFFDADGRLYYTGNFIVESPEYEGHHGIYICELDKESFQFIGERKIIWNGKDTHSKWIEAPHIYFRDGYYYLMVAEGGTFTNHSVMISRSKDIFGPYEPCDRNPIVTHRYLSLQREISVVGHGDLIEDDNGDLWMVLLGVRPYGDTHFNLGRETFLIPMIRENDGWPRVNNENGLVNKIEKAPNLKRFNADVASGFDSFDSEKLRFIWNSIHPLSKEYYSLADKKGYLSLYCKNENLEEIATPAFIGRRQQHLNFMFNTKMEFEPKNQEEAGIALVQDDRYHYTFTLLNVLGKKKLELRMTKNKKLSVIARAYINEYAGELYFKVLGSEAGYSFYYSIDGKTYNVIYENADLKVLSSIANEGFTGTYIGMYATSNHFDSENRAYFDFANYERLDN